MAQQKMFQPVLSEVGTPTYVAPGVQDTSMATLISGLGGQAVSAYKDWEVSRAGNQTIEAIEAYKKGDVDYFRPGTTADIEKAKNVALKAGQEMEARKFALEGQWDIAGAIPSDTSKTGMVGWKDIYEAESGLASQMSTFDEKLQNLKAAQAQGKVTPADFYARSLTIAREAINRTPGLQQEIARKMDSILKYSGMEDRLTLEQKALKAQQDAAVDNMKRLQAYADKEHIPYSFDTAPLELEMMVNKHKEKQYLLQAAQDVNTFSTAQGQARARAFIESGSSWKVRSAVQDNFVNNIYGSIKDLPPEKAAGVVANAIVTHREQAIRDYEQTLIRTGLPSTDPLFVKELEGLRSRLDAAAEAWKGLATGATAADIYTNIQRVNNVIDEQALAEQYGMTPTEMKYITPLVGNLAAAVVSKGDPGLLKEVQGMTLNFVKNITNGYANKQAGKPDVLGPATRSIFQLSKDYPADSTVKQYTENFFATLNTTIASTDAELTPRVKQNMMYTALKTAADPNNKEVNATLSATAVTEFNKMFGSFSTGHVQLMNDAKIEGALDVLPDGRLTITGGNAEQIRTLIEPINLAIEAYANVNGLDKQKATYIVLSQMFQQDPNLNSVLDDPDLKGFKIQFPANATPEQKKMAIDEAFTSGKIDGAQRQQIYEAEGLTSNVGTTPAAERPAAKPAPQPLPGPEDSLKEARAQLVKIDETLNSFTKGFLFMGAEKRKQLEKQREMLQLYIANSVSGNSLIDKEAFQKAIVDARSMLATMEPPPQTIEELKGTEWYKKETDPERAKRPSDKQPVQKETEAAKAVRDALGVSPPKGIETIPTVTRDIETLKPGSGKWYYHSKNENGTYLYNPSKDTYVLVAPGKEGEVAKKFGIDDITKIPKQGKK